jgi:hypothetical protein
VRYVDASVWDYSEAQQCIARLGWDNGKVAVQSLESGARAAEFSVRGAVTVKFVGDRLRICKKDRLILATFEGAIADEKVLAGSLVHDLGEIMITKAGSEFVVLDSDGERLGRFKRSGHGITSSYFGQGCLACAEGGGFVSKFTKLCELIWKITSPEGYSPMHVGITTDGAVLTIHGEMATMRSSIVTMHDVDGGLVDEERLEQCPAYVAFLPQEGGWVFNDKSIYRFGNRGS